MSNALSSIVQLLGSYCQRGIRSRSAQASTSVTRDQAPRSFIAKESCKRGNDLVFFGDELYKWRNEFNVRPAFIALRNIERGEEVTNNPEDLEQSDLMLHWGLTYQPDDK